MGTDALVAGGAAGRGRAGKCGSGTTALVANQNHSEMSPHTCQNGTDNKCW